MATLANAWARRGTSVTLITMESRNRDFFTIDAGVERLALDHRRRSTTMIAAVKNQASLLRCLRRAIRRSEPDCVISFIAHMNVLVLLATVGESVPVVVSDRANPSHISSGRLFVRLRPLVYTRAAAAVVQTESAAAWTRKIVSPERVFVIPNPVSPPGRTSVNPVVGVKRPYVAAMGRLVSVKGFDLLLEAFARCGANDWSLVILGDGPERPRLEELAERLEISSRVVFPGRVKNPVEILRRAGMFVLSSRTEGFPNALLEAMSVGVPAVSFDCVAGPSEIIRHGVDGLLVPREDERGLSKAIDRLAADRDERKRMGSRAREVADRFSLDRIMKHWESLLDHVRNQRS